MKFFKGLIYTVFLSLIVLNCWALKTKTPVVVSFPELQSMGIRNVDKIKSDLGITDESEKLIVGHVITTGKERASDEHIFLNIETLEQIKPPLQSSYIIRQGKQVSLSDAQVDSIIQLLKKGSNKIPRWLSDKSKKKYINVVLQKKRSTDSNISVLSAQDAKTLVNWAIDHQQLVSKDHP